MLFFVALIVGSTLFMGCTNEPMSKERLGKDDGFEVEYLFEKDGIKVYRFYDSGHFHYFTSNSETISTQTAGKQTYQETIKEY